VTLPCKSGHEESGVYNPLWGCSNEQEAQNLSERIKKESVRLIVEEGRRSSELSRELGISAGLLRNWIKLSKVDKIEPFPGQHKRFT
jgi:transposase-like protein